MSTAAVVFSGFFFLSVLVETGWCVSSRIGLGSRLSSEEGRAWVSENGTFAFGFTPTGSTNQYQLAIWFAELSGDRTVVWSANRNSPVGQNATLDFDTTGNLLLVDGNTTVWTSNTSGAGVNVAVMSENGNFILYISNQTVAWQSFSHPTDTLLPGQPLTASLELTSPPQPPSHGGYYTLKMLQQPTSLSLALSYNLPDSYATSPDSSNYSYWSGPDISNVTGDVVAVLNSAGSFGIVYGSSSDGAVYVYKNDGDNGTLSSATNQTLVRSSVLRRLTLETGGNLRLYRWDNDLNGSSQWVPEWAAVSNPCDIAGICGDGICNLDISKTNASCSSLPGNSSVAGKCGPSQHENPPTPFNIAVVQQTNYYYSESSVIANYSDAATVSKCGDACLTDCECVASVYGLDEEKPYCWVLRRLDFGGFEDPGSTLFVKVVSNGSSSSTTTPESNGNGSVNSAKIVVLPIVLSMTVLVGLLCCLLYISVHRRRSLKKSLRNSLILSGAPVNFSFRDLQSKTNNFSHLLGIGGFGSVYKGRLEDGGLVAVKRLERVLPHGEKEFVTEVNTIGSMHHLNLVRLYGYCSQGSQHRLLVYEFMKNGSLDKWIFPSPNCRDRILDWSTRFHIAVGTAQGIAYFHEQCRDRIIHCDIKPENILLDDNFCPKVSDFGLAKLMRRDLSHVVTMVRGTRGYLAPEWLSNRPITVKADVYSYGMLLLEIVAGRRNLDMSCGAEDFFFPAWAFKEMTNGTSTKVADRRLEGAVEEEELVRALRVAFWCIQDEVLMRPSMGEVVRMLEGSVEISVPIPMPQSVFEVIEEGFDQVYKAMKGEFNQFSSSFTIPTRHPSSSSHGTCNYSPMSPR